MKKCDEDYEYFKGYMESRCELLNYYLNRYESIPDHLKTSGFKRHFREVELVSLINNRILEDLKKNDDYKLTFKELGFVFDPRYGYHRIVMKFKSFVPDE